MPLSRHKDHNDHILCNLPIVFKDESFCFAKTVRGGEGEEENLLDILQMPESSVSTVFHAPVALWVLLFQR